MGRPIKISDEAILDGAIELFWRDGADVVSIRDLERALDVRAPSIYRRFESKDVLLAHCLDRYVDNEVGGRIDHFFDDTRDPFEGLRSFFTSVLRPHSGEHGLRGCLLTTTAGAAAKRTPKTQKAIQRGFDAIEAALLVQVERCMKSGQFDSQLDAQATAKSLLLTFEGLLLLARNGADGLRGNIDATFVALQPNPTPS